MTRKERIKYREEGILELLNSQFFQELLRENDINSHDFEEKLHELLLTKYNNVDAITKADINDYADYNNEDYNALLLTLMYLYHQTKGIDKLSRDITKIPFELQFIPKDIDYEEFIKIIDKIKTKRVPHTDKSQHEAILQLASEELLISKTDYLLICSRLITGVENSVNDYVPRIDLSIPKKDLCKFLNILLKKCIKYGITDFEFWLRHPIKWSWKESINSISILFTKENFAKYIKAIQEIKQEEPSIQFNRPNLYSYYYNRDISITLGNIDGQEGKNLSTLLTLLITKGLKKKLSNEELAEKISTGLEKIIEEKLHDLITLCDETKKALSETPKEKQSEVPEEKQSEVPEEKQNDIFITPTPNYNYTVPENATTSNPNDQLLIATGLAILPPKLHRMWKEIILTIYHSRYELNIALNIMILLKEKIPFIQIKKIFEEYVIYSEIMNFLSYFINQEVLEQITPQPPQKPKPKK